MKSMLDEVTGQISRSNAITKYPRKPNVDNIPHVWRSFRCESRFWNALMEVFLLNFERLIFKRVSDIDSFSGGPNRTWRLTGKALESYVSWVTWLKIRRHVTQRHKCQSEDVTGNLSRNAWAWTMYMPMKKIFRMYPIGICQSQLWLFLWVLAA